MPSDTPKKCRHDLGWCSVKNQCIWIGSNYQVRVGFKGANRVLMQCNNSDCTRVRYGTFMKRGAFVRLGRSRWARPGEL